MLAFHNDQSIKDKYLNRVRSHRLADEIIKGIYWENGKGCAVGCTLHSDQHSSYETELGIPLILARLEDGIFEGLPLERAKFWPEDFLSAINVGANLKQIWPKFAIWLLIDEKHGVIQYAKNDIQRNIIQTIVDYYSRYKEITFKEWIVSAANAYDASNNADSVNDTASAYATSSAGAAAGAGAGACCTATTDIATAYSAAYATASTYHAASAYSAYSAVASADAAVDARTDAIKESYRMKQADKLLELLKECK